VRLTVVLSGTSIIAKVDGVTRATATSSFNQTETMHGVWKFSGTELELPSYFDNFAVI
jgi:hypothetical protein